MTPQVISQEAVEAQLEERLQEQLVYRQAFRDLDASNVNSNVIKVPNPADAMAEPAAVDPTAEYPSTREEYEKISIERQKYGEIIEVPEEDVMDSVVDIVSDHVDLAAREMAEFLDGLAFSELSNNVATASPVSDGTADDNLTYDDIQEGVRALEENDAMPDLAFFGPKGKSDILKYLADRGTDLGDEAVTTGQFGAFAGLDFLYSTSGDITAHDCILVDSDRYGYEATFTPVETEEEQDFDRDVDKYKVRTRKGFKAIKSEAAVRVEG
jgi:HK97 family phage major capsid protein